MRKFKIHFISKLPNNINIAELHLAAKHLKNKRKVLLQNGNGIHPYLSF